MLSVVNYAAYLFGPMIFMPSEWLIIVWALPHLFLPMMIISDTGPSLLAVLLLVLLGAINFTTSTRVNPSHVHKTHSCFSNFNYQQSFLWPYSCRTVCFISINFAISHLVITKYRTTDGFVLFRSISKVLHFIDTWNAMKVNKMQMTGIHILRPPSFLLLPT